MTPASASVAESPSSFASSSSASLSSSTSSGARGLGLNSGNVDRLEIRDDDDEPLTTDDDDDTDDEDEASDSGVGETSGDADGEDEDQESVSISESLALGLSFGLDPLGFDDAPDEDEQVAEIETFWPFRTMNSSDRQDLKALADVVIDGFYQNRHCEQTLVDIQRFTSVADSLGLDADMVIRHFKTKLRRRRRENMSSMGGTPRSNLGGTPRGLGVTPRISSSRATQSSSRAVNAEGGVGAARSSLSSTPRVAMGLSSSRSSHLGIDHSPSLNRRSPQRSDSYGMSMGMGIGGGGINTSHGINSIGSPSSSYHSAVSSGGVDPNVMASISQRASIRLRDLLSQDGRMIIAPGATLNGNNANGNGSHKQAP